MDYQFVCTISVNVDQDMLEDAVASHPNLSEQEALSLYASKTFDGLVPRAMQDILTMTTEVRKVG